MRGGLEGRRGNLHEIASPFGFARTLERHPIKRKYLILFSLSGLVLTFDQLTKHLVTSRLLPQQVMPLLGQFLTLTHAKNSGFAFGLLEKAPHSLQNVFIIGIPIFALILIILIFIKLRDNQMLTSIALTTILGGAVGNLVDRLQYGYVIDFFQMHLGFFRFPPFNIADCSIIVGVSIMFVNTLKDNNNPSLAT